MDVCYSVRWFVKVQSTLEGPVDRPSLIERMCKALEAQPEDEELAGELQQLQTMHESICEWLVSYPRNNTVMYFLGYLAIGQQQLANNKTRRNRCGVVCMMKSYPNKGSHLALAILVCLMLLAIDNFFEKWLLESIDAWVLRCGWNRLYSSSGDDRDCNHARL